MSKKGAKTALVLAGGGLTGAVYEIGALRAIDDLLIDLTVNDFDIYVGTSAGALVASMLVNGISPEEMLQVIEGSNPDIQSIERQHIFNIDQRDMLSWGVHLPQKLLGAWLSYLTKVGEMTLFDLLWSLTGALPSGLYDSRGLERYIRLVLDKVGYSNSFKEVSCDLHIIATDLNTGERVVFASDVNSDVPISWAVAASSAVPLLYKPVRIGGREYVDGGLRGNASLDLAIEHGAELVVCINPMVPYHLPGEESIPSLAPRRKVGERGIQSIANQTLRIVTSAGLHYHVKQLRRSHPDIDIILIEPHAQDEEMFFTNIMHYASRLTVAQHGFESATLDLAEYYPLYKQILARHGINITRRLVIEEISEIQASGYSPEVIRRVLEARSASCGPNRLEGPLCDLDQVLDELNQTLNSLALDPVPNLSA
jgi:predicted acylesterase/phospholipase RssA